MIFQSCSKVYLGSHDQALFDEINQSDRLNETVENWEDGIISGHSENYIPVALKGNKDEVNQIIPVKLVRLENVEIVGKRLE